MTAIAPVAETDRIKSLDVMRGFAVLGILAVNAMYFAAPWQTAFNPALPPLDVNEATLWSWLLMHVVFEFKCITLFSMLFGVSIYLVGGERSDKERGAVLRRRLFWLMIFGLIHGTLIWFGDILLPYALTGFLVLFARSWKPHTLLIVGILLLGLSLLAMAAFAFAFPNMPADMLSEMKLKMWSPPDEEMRRQIEAYQSTLGSGIAENLATWMLILTGSLPVLIIRTAGVMMIGLALYKWGFMSGRSPVWVYWLMLAIGAAAFAAIACQALRNFEGGFNFTQMQSFGQLPNAALAIFGSLFFASFFILLVKGGVGFITGPLSAVGRMAFTNYLTQSLIMSTIFWGGRGLGLYGEVDRPTLWLFVLGVWVLQLIWSPLWLSKFQFGPFEWVWRRLTYGRPVQMTRRSPTPA